MEETRRKAAEAASLARTGSAILKTAFKVKWIPKDEAALGYTSGEQKTVFVAWYFIKYFEDLSQTERSLMRMGIFAHELLHQLLTDFEYTNKICDSMSQAEAAVFMKFANTLEDPAIEYFAPNCFGGTLLDALRFSIMNIYKKSPGIDKSTTAFSQLINALICFGDCGIVKGKFTFPEAKEYFKKVAPIYNHGITCPDSRKRIDIAKECMELTRPLWEEEVKNHEAFMKLLEELMDALKQSGLHLMKDKEARMKGENTKTSIRRAKNAEAMDNDNMANDDIDAEGDLNKDDTLSDDADTDTDEEKLSASKPLNKASDSTNADDQDTSPQQSTDHNGEPNTDNTDMDNVEMSDDDADELADSLYEIDESVLNSIEKTLEEEEHKLAQSEREEDTDNKPLPDFDITSSVIKKARCLNQRVSSTGTSAYLSALYNQETAKYSREIKSLKKTLDEIFKSDKEECSRSTRGSYNIIRGTVGTSARIFDKKRDPGNFKDAAIVLAVDLSGSMACGTKMHNARKCAIVFAEALSQLKIPYYIMGFSADMYGADAVHKHFVDWSNKRSDRETLVSMEANGNNFDGYSIRYASKLLEGRNANNKILFIISDGEPVCNYYSYDTGISDTVNAIKDARKICTTFGIAVGRGCRPEVLQGMYGKDFIYCEDDQLLSNTLGKKMAKLLRAG